MTKLTSKQQKFKDLILEGYTKKDAYIEAYNCENMKDSTIYAGASNLFRSPKIQAALLEVQEKVLEENKATVENVIAELCHLAFTDIKNYLEYKTVAKDSGKMTEEGEPIWESETIVILKNSKDVDTRAVSEVRTNPNGSFSFKLYSKDKALENLGKILGLFVEKWEGSIDGDKTNPITVEHTFATEQIASAFKALYQYKKDEKREKDKATK